MKILIASSHSTYTTGKATGGAETSLRLIAEKLAARGHQVTYLTKGDVLYPGWLSEQVNGVTVVFMPRFRRWRFSWLPSGVRGYIDSFLRRLSEFWLDRLMRKVPALKDPDIVHTYYELVWMTYFLNRREVFGYKLVVRMAGLYWATHCHQKPSKAAVYQEIFNQLDAVNFISDGIRELTEKEIQRLNMSVTFRSSFTADIGIELRELPNRWLLPGGGTSRTAPFRMIMASRFSLHQKRQDLLLEAVALLPEHLHIHVQLAGDGPNREFLQHRIRELKLQDRVELVAFLPQEELWKRMLESHLYVHACDFEGLSKIVVEALGMGMPVLASNVVPLNDYIEDGRNGFLTQNSGASWAQKLEYLIEHKNLLEPAGEQGRLTVEKRYRADKNVEIYEDQFQQLTGRDTGDVLTAKDQQNHGR